VQVHALGADARADGARVESAVGNGEGEPAGSPHVLEEKVTPNRAADYLFPAVDTPTYSQCHGS
jgi:hypothetical protein